MGEADDGLERRELEQGGRHVEDRQYVPGPRLRQLRPATVRHGTRGEALWVCLDAHGFRFGRANLMSYANLFVLLFIIGDPSKGPWYGNPK